MLQDVDLKFFHPYSCIWNYVGFAVNFALTVAVFSGYFDRTLLAACGCASLVLQLMVLTLGVIGS